MIDPTPGAALALLDRGRTSTRVLLFERDAPDPPFPWRAPDPARSQWALAEALCVETWANEVSRLYASPLALEHAGHRLGCFVGFLDQDAADAPLPAFAGWHDLRDAAQDPTTPWRAALAEIRRTFVARSPDEALRVR